MGCSGPNNVTGSDRRTTVLPVGTSLPSIPLSGPGMHRSLKGSTGHGLLYYKLQIHVPKRVLDLPSLHVHMKVEIMVCVCGGGGGGGAITRPTSASHILY